MHHKTQASHGIQGLYTALMKYAFSDCTQSGNKYINQPKRSTANIYQRIHHNGKGKGIQSVVKRKGIQDIKVAPW